jgi:TonB family protein
MKRLLFILALLTLAALVTGADQKKAPVTKSNNVPPDTIMVKHEVEPEMIKEVNPEYPAQAKKDSIEAKLVVKAFIDKTGEVKSAEVIKCSHPGVGFEEAAIKAAYANKFKPALSGGKPVGVWVSYTVKFTLAPKSEPSGKVKL